MSNAKNLSDATRRITNMELAEAISIYWAWAERHGYVPMQPCRTASRAIAFGWKLENGNGPIAYVCQNGCVSTTQE